MWRRQGGADGCQTDAHDADAKGRPPEWGNSSAAAFETLARDCLAQFARQYAPAADSADEVAKAVATACAAEVGFVTSEAYFAHEKGGMSLQVAQLTSDGSKAKFAAEAQRLVVEARAGHCAPPPSPSKPRLADLRD